MRMVAYAKEGDTVVCVKSGDWALTNGAEYKALLGTNDRYVRVVSDNGREANYYQDRFSIAHSIESPIRTVARREPISGKYSNGDVDVSVHPDGQIQISVSMLTLKGDRVRSACMVLSQLAEFLDEDKGEE